MGYRDELLVMIDRIFTFFIDGWHCMCEPYLGRYYTSAAGQPPHLVPEHSYATLIFAICFTFMAIGLTKKLIFLFIERR